jgi:protein-L-isoaspartate(D-aspartate) O-methyltransferase
VLEIGTGSGYQTAVLAELAGEVFTVERRPGLAARARTRLVAMGYDNVRFRVADGAGGWPESAPFDRILLAAAAPGIPRAILDQLADPGILTGPVGPRGVQQLVSIRRVRGRDETKKHFSCAFVPLVGLGGYPD